MNVNRGILIKLIKFNKEEILEREQRQWQGRKKQESAMAKDREKGEKIREKKHILVKRVLAPILPSQSLLILPDF
jgi:hypothetical protein